MLLKATKTKDVIVPIKLRIPLTRVRGILFAVPRSSREQIARERAILQHRLKTDVLVLNNGDRISTVFQSLDSSTVKSKGGGKTKREAVIAIAFNPQYLEFPQRKGIGVLLELTDGSRLTAVRVSCAGGDTIQINAAFGGTLQLPVAAVKSMRILGGRAVSLSDLKPASYQFTPYLDGRWNYTRDRPVTAGRLLLRGRVYAKGLGMHSASRLTFDISGKDLHFMTTVGIDDASGGKGSVIVAVELDGKRVFKSKLLTGRDPPLRIGPLSLSGKKQITLIVEFGERADVLDFVNWCDAVFVKGPSS